MLTVVATLTGPLTYENKSKLPKYEVYESLKTPSELEGSDNNSHQTNEEDEDEERMGELQSGSESEIQGKYKVLISLQSFHPLHCNVLVVHDIGTPLHNCK